MLKPVFIVAFSGHRPDRTPGRTVEVLEATGPHLWNALKAVKEKVEASGAELHFLSCVAEGADIMACEAAVKLGLPLHVILPKPEKDFMESLEEGGSNGGWRKRAETLVAGCRTLREGSRARKSPDYYIETNSRMLDMADLLLTVCNGGEPKSRAGTTHLIGLAKKLLIPCINIDPRAPDFRAEDHEMRLRRMLGHASESLGIFSRLRHHVPGVADTAGFRSVATALGNAAKKSSDAFTRRTSRAIKFHAIAGFIAAAAAAFYHLMHHAPLTAVLATLALLEFLLVLAAFIMEHRVKKSGSQHIWLECRFARELMRGLEAAAYFQDPLYTQVGRHLREWRRFVTTCALQLPHNQGPGAVLDEMDVERARGNYVKDRISDQIGHFRKQLSPARFTDGWLRGMSHWVGPAALVVVGIAFVVKSPGFSPSYKPSDGSWLSAFFTLFLPILLPLLASLSASLLGAFDFSRRSVRYREMIILLLRMRRKFRTLHTYEDIKGAVQQTERVFLHEQIEWLAAQKSGFGH